MFQQVDDSLRRTLVAELGRTIGCPIYDPAQITFDPPRIAETVQDGEAYVNLFLYDVRENAQLRDDSHRLVRRPEEGTAGRKRGMARLDLAYLVTVYASDDVRAEHRLLADTLAVFLRWPALPGLYLEGDLKSAGDKLVTVRISQPDQIALSDLASLWQSFGGTIRPALHLTVTIPFDPFETKWTRTVREATFGLTTVPTVGQGNNTERPPITVAARLSVAGIVVDQTMESPLAGVEIRVSTVPDRIVSTDAQGVFRLLDLPAGMHHLLLTQPGFRTVELPVEVAGPGRHNLEPITIGMRPETDAEVVERGRTAGQFSRRLRYADGKPARYVGIQVGRRATSTDQSGIFHLPDTDEETTVHGELPGIGEVEIKTNGDGYILSLPEEPSEATP